MRHRLSFPVTLLFLALPLAPLTAAQTSSSQTGTTTSTKPAAAPDPAGSETPKPPPEMERLIKMWTGRWSTVEESAPSVEKPQGGHDVGAETMRPGPGDFSVIGDYESHGAFFGHLVVTWIPQERIYKSYWVDRTQPGVSLETGRWEGEKLVFTGADESTGEKLAVRDTYSDITPGSFTDELEMGSVGGPLKKILTVKYTKSDKEGAPKGPCDDPKTQMESNQCSAEQFREADAHLNTVYDKLMNSLRKELAASEQGKDSFMKTHDETAIQKLKEAERAWIQYRDLHCDAAKHEFQGGSIVPTVWSNCMKTVTNHRTEELIDAYHRDSRNLE
jgi:uncharacterized protein YecT (DUF1311 family)